MKCEVLVFPWVFVFAALEGRLSFPFRLHERTFSLLAPHTGTKATADLVALVTLMLMLECPF